jgi:hypothetical protein
MLIAGGALAYGHESGTLAIFTADTENPSAVFQGSWVVGPSAFNVPVASGNGQYFTWTAGNHGVNAEEVYFADQGATANCTGASYSNALYSGGTALGAAIATIDGANAGTSSDVPAANIGHYICYQVRSTYNAWYTATNVGTAVQVGLVPTSISYNGGGQVQTNTVFTIGYNHTPAYSGGDINVVVALGSVTFAGIGTVTGTFSKAFTCTHTSGAANVVVSGATVQVTLKGCPGGAGGKAAVTAGTHGTYTATGSTVTSSIGPAGHAYAVNQCNVAAVCFPIITY